MRARQMAPVGMAAAPGLCWALCAWEARRARGGAKPYTEALPADDVIGHGLHGDLHMAWLGDSLAAGLGCDHVADTPAHLTARLLERRVSISMLAIPGARVADVAERQLPNLPAGVDLVVLSVGANDVASSASRREYTARLDHLLAELAPTPTVMLSLPDMSMPDRMAQPLRTFAGARGRWFEAGRAAVVLAHPHASSVDVATRPEGVSRQAGRSMLCADRFHPGPLGYRVWAERIAAACEERLGVPEQPLVAAS